MGLSDVHVISSRPQRNINEASKAHVLRVFLHLGENVANDLAGRVLGDLAEESQTKVSLRDCCSPIEEKNGSVRSAVKKITTL